MTKPQQNLLWVALGAFALTLLTAPWQVTDYAAFDNASMPHIAKIVYSPIWDPPPNQYGRSEIQVSTIMVEWMATGIAYVALSALVKARTQPAQKAASPKV